MNTAKENGGRGRVERGVVVGARARTTRALCGQGERLRGQGVGGEGASARGGEGTAPVVCRPTDKQRRYCKCIGTTRCGASLAAFLRDVTQRALVVYRIDSPIVKRSILSYRLSRRGEARGRNNRCNVPALYLDSALGPLFLTLSSYSLLLLLLLSLSLFSFFFLVVFWYQKDRPRARPLFISLSDQPRSRPASFAVVHALARTLLPFTRPSSSPCHSPTSRSLLVTLFLTLSLSKAVSRPLPSTPLLSFSLSLSGDDGLARRTT